MNLTAYRLTAQQGRDVLTRFYTAWGPEQMEASYHWKSVPKTLIVGERMYAFQDPETAPGAYVGWGSFVLDTRDADDEEARLSVGVFPDWQRKGYRRAILDFLCAKAARLGAARMQQIVFKTNTEHYERTKRESQSPDSPWIYAGDVWYPAPGYGYWVRELQETK